MTVEEAKVRESNLISQINGMIQDFEQATGMNVVDISMTKINIGTMGDPDRTLNEVKVVTALRPTTRLGDLNGVSN